MAAKLKKFVVKSWPKEVPVLTPSDIVCGEWNTAEGPGGYSEACLVGQARWTFNGWREEGLNPYFKGWAPLDIDSVPAPYYPRARQRYKKVLIALYKSLPLRAQNLGGPPESFGISALEQACISFNDGDGGLGTPTHRRRIAKVFNRAMEKLGYVA